MTGRFIKERRPADRQPAKGQKITEQAVRRQLAWASSTEQFQSRDPMFHITENFMRSFDMLGAMRAETGPGLKPEGPGLTDAMGKKPDEQDAPAGIGAAAERSGAKKNGAGGRRSDALLQQSAFNNEFEENGGAEDGDRLMNKFSEMSFMRGKMSAAVLNGTGNMMLFSCLKRTLGQSQPMKLQQRKLFQGASRQWKPRNTTASDAQGTTFVRNEVFADSAVGMVFNVARDARRTVGQMTELVERGVTGSETMERMWPFLSFQKEEAMLAQYRQRLEELGGDPQSERERMVLGKAVTRTETLLNKKRQMRNEFMFKLRAVSNQAREAAALFSGDDFKAELRQALQADETYPPPPEGTGNYGEGETAEQTPTGLFSQVEGAEHEGGDAFGERSEPGTVGQDLSGPATTDAGPAPTAADP